MLRRLIGKFGKYCRRIVLDSTKKAFAYRCVEGPWWEIYLFGATEEDSRALVRRLLALRPESIEQFVRSDFDSHAHLETKVPILHCPPHIRLHHFLRAAKLPSTCLEQSERPEGFYSPFISMGVVSGPLAGADFEETLMHELCHACYCEIAGAKPRLPWAVEGYAELVVARCAALSGKQAPRNLRRSLETVVELIQSGHLMSLEKLLRLRWNLWTWLRGPVVRGYPWIVPHSAMLMYMFMRMSVEGSSLLTACKKAVKGDYASPNEIARAIERSANCTLAELHERFIAFCENLATHSAPAPQILRPDTMQQCEAAGCHARP